MRLQNLNDWLILLARKTDEWREEIKAWGCCLNKTSVAEPEPVERQLFAGAGAEVLLAQLRILVCKFL
jgi:hypothetical protein